MSKHPLHPSRMYADMRANQRDTVVMMLALSPVLASCAYVMTAPLHGFVGFEATVFAFGGPEPFAIILTGMLAVYSIGLAFLTTKGDDSA